jgi:hypothetical protein
MSRVLPKQTKSVSAGLRKERTLLTVWDGTQTAAVNSHPACEVQLQAQRGATASRACCRTKRKVAVQG